MLRKFEISAIIVHVYLQSSVILCDIIKELKIENFVFNYNTESRKGETNENQESSRYGYNHSVDVCATGNPSIGK